MKSFKLLVMTLIATRCLHAQAPLPFDQNKDVKTGPAIGEHIPRFRAVDQNGRWLDFDAIKGPHGAVLVFHRSADW